MIKKLLKRIKNLVRALIIRLFHKCPQPLISHLHADNPEVWMCSFCEKRWITSFEIDQLSPAVQIGNWEWIEWNENTQPQGYIEPAESW